MYFIHHSSRWKKCIQIQFLAIYKAYVFHSMHKLFAQGALTGKSVVSVNHIQCGQPLPNLTEMWSVVLEIKHENQCAQKHSVTWKHFVQVMHRWVFSLWCKGPAFLTEVPLGKSWLLNAMCHFSSRSRFHQKNNS